MAREKIPRHTERATTLCRNAKPESKQFELLDETVPGLELRVNSKGKEWSLRYRIKIGDKWGNKRLPLGEFPAVTVANARDAALKAKTDISRGMDPMGDRQKQAEQRALEIEAKALEIASRVSVDDAFERWMASALPSGRADKGEDLRRLFTNDVLPCIGKKQIKDVTVVDIHTILDQMLARGVNRRAQQALSEMRQFFDFAKGRKIVSSNPTNEIKKKDVGKPSKPRERALSTREIRQLDQALHTSSLNRVTHIIYMLQISVTCRINELCQAPWSEMNWNRHEWTIAAERNKSRREIVISLSTYSLSLLRELHKLTGHTPWLYPGQNEQKPVNIKQAANHARDRQLPEGQPPLEGRTIQTRSLVLDGGPWRTHDLRRSGTTLMQQLGVPGEVSERCLNHVEGNKMKSTYHRYDYEREMKRAWHILGEALAVITGPAGERFLDEADEDHLKDIDDEIGFLNLVKQHYIKPVPTEAS
ncbi:tyrosine-type recombinase/integrase [Pseudomonas izuensis]|uniref:Integrase n=1 Tax=Pseudomonas izuensis TaxID=2684212 RepID=A0ABM7RQS5_9PSED|nr:integrase arm-type DNA-binding domain-containing protein [Pseudomonas izuensis]BCX67271.1 integrase [Pseudomonas izuensis]